MILSDEHGCLSFVKLQYENHFIMTLSQREYTIIICYVLSDVLIMTIWILLHVLPTIAFQTIRTVTVTIYLYVTEDDPIRVESAMMLLFYVIYGVNNKSHTYINFATVIWLGS